MLKGKSSLRHIFVAPVAGLSVPMVSLLLVGGCWVSYTPRATSEVQTTGEDDKTEGASGESQTSTAADTEATSGESQTSTAADTEATSHSEITETSSDTELNETGSDTHASETEDNSGGSLTCEYYCDLMNDICSDQNIYINNQVCLSQCRQWPEGNLDDASGDSLGCRTYHATLATTDDPIVHCPHASPNGGGLCVDEGAPDCQTYCTNYLDACIDDLNPYENEGDCLTQCSEWYQGGQNDLQGDTVGCRTYHATAALGDPYLHCPHAAPGGGGVCVAQ